MGLKDFVKDVAEVCVEEVEELDETVFSKVRRD
ncbi:hypothetical protein BMS3Abin17_00069 [archaeon BMS3Abin17]|nr:hypothetical protein BMS3Abin17_00069 [archaeon BMS3Abin17]